MPGRCRTAHVRDEMGRMTVRMWGNGVEKDGKRSGGLRRRVQCKWCGRKFEDSGIEHENTGSRTSSIRFTGAVIIELQTERISANL